MATKKQEPERHSTLWSPKLSPEDALEAFYGGFGEPAAPAARQQFHEMLEKQGYTIPAAFRVGARLEPLEKRKRKNAERREAEGE